MRFDEITDVLLNISFLLLKNETGPLKDNDTFFVCIWKHASLSFVNSWALNKR